MSSSLHFRVLPADKPALSDAIKRLLARKYWHHDGSISGDPVQLSTQDIEYLGGLADAGDKEVSADAKKLIDAITKHDEVELYWLL